jgi:hypothetical protein
VGEDMSEYTGPYNGTLRVTIREAAARLGVTEAAIRKRIQRRSLNKELGSDGRVYVYLDLTQDISHLESQVHRDPLVEELVEELKDRVAFLERALEQRSVEAERYQQIVAGLTQTNNQLATQLCELEAPQAPSGGPQGRTEPPDRIEQPHPATGSAQHAPERPRDTAEFPVRGSLTSPWWRRVFGG